MLLCGTDPFQVLAVEMEALCEEFIRRQYLDKKS